VVASWNHQLGAGVHSPQFVLVAVTAIAVVALFAGGYISARYVAPRALIHPVLAALAVSFYMCHCSPRAILMA